MTNLKRVVTVLGALIALFWGAAHLQAIDISASKPEGGRGGATINPESDPKEARKPSLLSNPFKWLFPKSDPRKLVEAPPEFDADLQVGKKNYSSAVDDAIEVKMVLKNKSNNKYILRFPTAQHYDFIIQDEKNQELYRWSSDKEFAAKISTIIVNSNERLSYPGQEPLLIPLSLNGNPLPPGHYTLVGFVTTDKPIKVSASFEVVKENSVAGPQGGSTHSTSPAIPALPLDEPPPEQ